MAAGLGFKTFTTGEVLSAANVNGYLMQGINVFASAAARDAAITSPQEGQYAYLKDTNATVYYDGSAWVSAGGTSGGMTSIASGTLSSTGVNITSIPSTYVDLVLYVTAIVNATDNRGLTLRFNSDTGTTYNRGNTVANTSNLTFGTDYIDGLVGMGTTNTYSIVKITIPNYAGTTHWKLLTGVGIYQNKDNAGNVNFKNYQAAWNQTSAISTLNIVSQDGTSFSGGSYVLYGVK